MHGEEYSILRKLTYNINLAMSFCPITRIHLQTAIQMKLPVISQNPHIRYETEWAAIFPEFSVLAIFIYSMALHCSLFSLCVLHLVGVFVSFRACLFSFWNFFPHEQQRWHKNFVTTLNSLRTVSICIRLCCILAHSCMRLKCVCCEWGCVCSSMAKEEKIVHNKDNI